MRGSLPSSSRQLPATSTSTVRHGVPPAGRGGCFLSADGSAQVVWTDADAGVISFAIARPSQDVEDLFSWWASLPVLVPGA